MVGIHNAGLVVAAANATAAATPLPHSMQTNGPFIIFGKS